MFVSQHIAVAALCLALFSLPFSVAQTTDAPTLTTTVTTTATVTTPSIVPTVIPSYAGWTYVGCYNETTGIPAAGNVRALNGNSTANDAETIQVCILYCEAQSQTFTYAGLEYGRECYCGPNINTNSQKLNEDKCGIPCMGDRTQICGGLLTLSVYKRDSTSTSDAIALPRRTSTFFEPVLGSLLAIFAFGLIMP